VPRPILNESGDARSRFADTTSRTGPSMSVWRRVNFNGGKPVPTAMIAKMGRLAAAVSVCVALTMPAGAEVRILGSPGGTVGTFLDLYAQVRASGERVVIDGPCLSACTLILAYVPHDRLCVTGRAVLGFHGARSVDAAGRTHAEPEASQRLLSSYPQPVRGWIERHGGLSSRLLLLRGRELAAMYPRCK
jgi:hypothetical protein